jgi:hypothetical protein
MLALLDTEDAGAAHATTKKMPRKETGYRDSFIDRGVTLSLLVERYLTSRTPIIPWSSWSRMWQWNIHFPG